VLKIILLLLTLLTAHQESTPAAIRLEARDGLRLMGLYWEGEREVGVLLIPMTGGRGSDWEALIGPLHEAGYHVLAIDVRGYGATRHRPNWPKAIDDTVDWLGWLDAQPGVEDAAAIGASSGANLAIIGCAAYDACRTAVAISPILDFQGLRPGDSLPAMEARSILLIGSHSDSGSANAARQLAAAAPGEVGLRLFSPIGMEFYSQHPSGTGLGHHPFAAAHGTYIFHATGSRAVMLIMNWMEEHFTPGD
jgi:pimeloyl-ACP methyl ester carboxylesterase